MTIPPQPVKSGKIIGLPVQMNMYGEPRANVAGILHPHLDRLTAFLAPNHVATQFRTIRQSGVPVRIYLFIFKPARLVSRLVVF